MRLPFRRKPEARESATPFTDAVINATEQAASGTGTATAASVGALEACAGVLGRAIAAAEVSGAGAAENAISPAFLNLTAREMLRRGEAVFSIEVANGRVNLQPVGSWDVQGNSPAESEWTYRVDVFGPSSSHTRLVSSAEVLHFRWSVNPARPYLGIGPLQVATTTGRLAGNLEAALANEAGTPTGHLLPGPSEAVTPPFKAALQALKGGLRLVTTSRESEPGAAPQFDWKPQRLGANPPQAIIQAREAAERTIAAACGIPYSLIGESEGMGQREAYRRLQALTVTPTAMLIESELRAKLDAPMLALRFDGLRAADIEGRARSAKALVAAGVDADRALRIAGLEG